MKSNVKRTAIVFICLFVFFYLIAPLFSMVTFRFMNVEEMGHLNVYIHASILILCPFVFCISFFLTKQVINDRKKWIWFLPVCVVASIFPIFFTDIISHFLSTSAFEATLKTNVIFFFNNLLGAVKVSVFAIICYLSIDWYSKYKKTKELEKQNLQSELALLKNQVNPHFLFNTLNNIDSLIKSNPEHASQSLVELSGMMRYMLYETDPLMVPLQKELDYINNYLKLQKLQYPNQELVTYSQWGDPSNKQVVPMIFIPFIENAFKHCTDKNKKHAISFNLDITDTHINFRTRNISDKTHVINKDSSSGVGLETVRRRLELIYPNKHSLKIYEKDDLFCVELSIETND